ncbi:MAG: tRNA lysidine(34) synthetase TilS [Candidatus ainarchaeum sp.]|nr:tRNA lysidine(34) synthetase TilS [Candidatus ainarchaeum sp.]
MDNILKTIKESKLIKAGEVIGVAVSGGSDSMSLLHYLHSHSAELDVEVIAIHIDHSIRENSAEDASFVVNYCKENGIRVYKFKVDVPKLVAQRKQSIETVARDARLGVFDALLKKDAVDKIAIAHNSKDQAETILLNLFRGTGLDGASGMVAVRDKVFIRPMLNTSKKAIMDYIFLNDIPFREDETNKDNSYSRNYIRNLILPLIEEKWEGATQKIVNFGKDCADDSNYINSQIFDDAIIFSEKSAKIPNSYFLYPNSIVSRMIFNALKKIDVEKDIERVHIRMIKELAISGENGKKIKLPLNVTAYKEYDYITIINKKKEEIVLNEPFAVGSFQVENFGTITVKRTKNKTVKEGELILDGKKLPKDVSWRFKMRGDIFEKFGGGTKKLKDYLIDKKIPNRLRENLPILASGSTIFAIAGVEIADSVRVDENTEMATKIIVS